MSAIAPSSLLRTMNCDGSIVLPRAENYSAAAEAGTEEHAELADFANLEPNIARHMPLQARSEVKLAYNVMTGKGRIIGYGADRKYGTLGTYEVAGTADVIGIDGALNPDGAVIIRDFKTGYTDVEPAATNPQLWFYALAFARAIGRSKARVGIIYTKTGVLDEAELDSLDLDMFATKLRILHQHVAWLQANPPAHPNTVEGRWCAYCPCKHVCPSKNALLVQVAAGGMAAMGDSEMTPHRAALAYQQLVKVEDLVRDAKARLNQYVKDHGAIDLGNGRAYGRYVRPGNERLNGAVAENAILMQIVGSSMAESIIDVAIEKRTSKAAIERACKATNQPRGTAPAIIRRIRELGGASNAPETMPVGEYAADRNEPAPKLDADLVNQLLESVK